jgi:YgiT-type zinc finger domain-containing protein
VTVTLERASSLIVLKDVPAMICENCGDYYLDESTTQLVLKRAEEAVSKGAEVEIIKMKMAG